jgi:hypothetical protein
LQGAPADVPREQRGGHREAAADADRGTKGRLILLLTL